MTDVLYLTSFRPVNLIFDIFNTYNLPDKMLLIAVHNYPQYSLVKPFLLPYLRYRVFLGNAD